jgi:ATP-binding cassette subfamily B protein
LLIEGALTVGGFVAFGIYLAMLTWPLIALGWTINLFQRGAASMGRVLELLDADPEQVRDTGTATLPPSTHGRAIEFRHVWFAYPTPMPATDGTTPETAPETAPDTAPGAVPHTEPRWVLRDVSFRIPAGGTLAIVGATGSGKSALLDLIPRLFDPQRGEVRMDDIPIATLPLDALRREIGYVPQDTLLFSETIGTNIAYGIPEHDLPEGDASLPEMVEVTDASTIAQLAETVAELPDGFQTPLGERGINLSGGQKQRTALARALARRPHVVLLDDSLSAVDTQTEAAILQGLRSALAGRTAIIASHRISAVRDADWILVLDNGAIVEQGRHDELMSHDGRYRQLLRRQQLLEAVAAA